MNLHKAPNGKYRVVSLSEDGQLDQLKAMGLVLGREIDVMMSGETVIVKILKAKIGISSDLANQIEVSMI